MFRFLCDDKKLQFYRTTRPTAQTLHEGKTLCISTDSQLDLCQTFYFFAAGCESLAMNQDDAKNEYL